MQVRHKSPKISPLTSLGALVSSLLLGGIALPVYATLQYRMLEGFCISTMVDDFMLLNAVSEDLANKKMLEIEGSVSLGFTYCQAAKIHLWDDMALKVDLLQISPLRYFHK